MQDTRVVLVVVCLFVAAFGGGAVTYAQMSDTERATVSATAGNWTTSTEEDIFCSAGDIIYEYKQKGNTKLVPKTKNDPDPIAFSEIEYVKSGNNKGITSGHFEVKEDFEPSIEIIAIKKIAQGNSQSKSVEFEMPKTEGDFNDSGLGIQHINKLKFCAVVVDTTQTKFSSSSVETGPSSASAPTGIGISSVETPETETQTQTPTETTVETPSTTTGTVTETPETATPETETPTPTETETTTTASVDVNHPLENSSSGNETTATENTSATSTATNETESQS